MDPALSFQIEQAGFAARKPQTPDIAKIKNQEQARETAEDFEAMFLTQMVEEMFAGLDTENMFGGGHAEKMFRSMLSQEYAKVMSGRGGVGIADMVQKQILMMQEEASK
mgnify:CR=1 FL=1